MQIESTQAAAATLQKVLEEPQKIMGKLIPDTVDKLHSGMRGMTPMIEKDYAMQKSVLSAAYGEQGIGTRLDMEV